MTTELHIQEELRKLHWSIVREHTDPETGEYYIGLMHQDERQAEAHGRTRLAALQAALIGSQVGS
jgi:hypothetical protein